MLCQTGRRCRGDRPGYGTDLFRLWDVHGGIRPSLRSRTGGATVIPASGGNSERQLMYMQDFGTTALIATPSYALYLSEFLQEQGISTDSLNLRLGLFGERVIRPKCAVKSSVDGTSRIRRITG
jgi:phenylacetate-coenzyme A ligase PaaK-like adenylate-forming protein